MTAMRFGSVVLLFLSLLVTVAACDRDRSRSPRSPRHRVMVDGGPGGEESDDAASPGPAPSFTAAPGDVHL